MDFASKYAYLNKKAVKEEADEMSAPSDGAPAPAGAVSSAPMRWRGGEGRHRDLERRIPPPPAAPMTNVCRIDVGSVGSAATIATGDPTVCGSCNSVLSAISKVEKAADGTYNWNCEYCGAVNAELNLFPEELPEALPRETPGSKGVDYLIAPPPAVSGIAGAPDSSNSSIIFVCDTSGSMCISEPLADGVARRLRGAHTDELQRLRAAGDDANQFLASERRGIQYVSRMQALQAAVSHQVENLATTKPNYKVGLVAFATDVTILGDGQSEPRTLAGSRLQDFDVLKAAGEGYVLGAPVGERRGDLVNKIFNLKEEGQTALGPAILVAVAMAAQQAGSKVIVITDGMSNIGVGSLEPADFPRGTTEEAKKAAIDSTKQAADTFFARLSSYASSAGVAVDVIGFEGANCNLEALGRLAEATSGNLMRVNPANITEQFSSILEDEVVATNATVTMTGHAGLFIRDPVQAVDMDVDVPVQLASAVSMLLEKYAFRAGKVQAQRFAALLPMPAVPEERKSELESVSSDVSAPAPVSAAISVGGAGEKEKPPTFGASSLTMHVGNVTASSEVTFEYGQKLAKELSPALKAELESLKQLPFQVQISYTRKDGALCMRVLTSAVDITTEAAEAESNMFATPIVSHAARSAAALAKKGKYATSSAVTAQYQGFIARNVRSDDVPGRATYEAWNVDADQLQTALRAEMDTSKASKSGISRRAAAPSSRAPLGSATASVMRSMVSSVAGIFRGSSSPAEPESVVRSAELASSDAAHYDEFTPAYEGEADAAVDLGSDEEEESDATAHVERRAANDKLAAQIFSMGRGGKGYSKGMRRPSS